MAKKKYSYWVYDEEDGYEIETVWDESNGRYIAEDCAEDFHSNHDGWELSWPLTINVVGIGAFEVDREAVPAFHAVEKK